MVTSQLQNGAYIRSCMHVHTTFHQLFLLTLIEHNGDKSYFNESFAAVGNLRAGQ